MLKRWLMYGVLCPLLLVLFWFHEAQAHTVKIYADNNSVTCEGYVSNGYGATGQDVCEGDWISGGWPPGRTGTKAGDPKTCMVGGPQTYWVFNQSIWFFEAKITSNYSSIDGGCDAFRINWSSNVILLASASGTFSCPAGTTISSPFDGTCLDTANLAAAPNYIAPLALQLSPNYIQ